MSPAPRPDPASLLPLSQSTLSLGACPSQLCPDVPRTRAKSARPARAASARVGRASPPPCGETLFLRPGLTCKAFAVLPVLLVLGIGMPGPAEWDWSRGI